MSAKIALLIFILAISGCYIGPWPKGYQYSKSTIDSDTIDSIVENQFVPQEVHNLVQGNIVTAKFRDHVCPCNYERYTHLNVAEVDSTGIEVFEISHSGTVKKQRPLNWSGKEGNYQDVCKLFIEAKKAIEDATNMSYQQRYYSEEETRLWYRRDYYFPESFELIWEAERAMGSLECDPVKSKVLADKAKEIAMDKGAKAFGLDVSGTYYSELSGGHPLIKMLYEFSGSKNPNITIKETDGEILGTDSSDRALIKGERFHYPTKPLMRDIIRFKLSYPNVAQGEMEGQWRVGDDVSSLEGEWFDSGGNVSGKWNIFRINQIRKAEPQEKMPKHLKKFFSKKSAVKIEWDQIEKIEVDEKELEFEFIIRSL